MHEAPATTLLLFLAKFHDSHGYATLCGLVVVQSSIMTMGQLRKARAAPGAGRGGATGTWRGAGGTWYRSGALTC